MAPPLLRVATRRAQNASSRAVVSVPAITSLCPFRYLVAECMTRSAPRLSGRVSTGVAAVLSTASNAPPAWAISAAPAMSVTDHSGFRRRLDPNEARPARTDRPAQRIERSRIDELHRETPGL